MNINLLVLSIIKQINELRVRDDGDKVSEGDAETAKDNGEKNASALIFVILEICVKDLIKYLPDLLTQSSRRMETDADVTESGIPKSSFLYLHVARCKQVSAKDVELIANVLVVLNQLPFHSKIKFESKKHFKRVLL